MESKITALLALQAVERQLAQVRGRLRARKSGVSAQQKKIDQLRADYDALREKALTRRRDADRLELDLRQRDEQVTKQRAALNTAKTNKEYAAILTHINTLRADNSKLEEEALAIIQEVEVINQDAAKLLAQVEQEQQRLTEIQNFTSGEIERLETMAADLSQKRVAAAQAVAPEILEQFDRLAETYEGEAMALIEPQGGSARKGPESYVCGGCYMTLSPEHVVALLSREDLRTCNNCGRILYLQQHADKAKSK